MANAGTIVVELEIVDGEFRDRILRGAAALEALGNQATATGTQIQRAERRIQSKVATLRDLTVILGQARSAFELIRQVTIDWGFAILKNNGELERMKVLMQGLERTGNAAEAINNAKQNFEGVVKLASESPFKLNEITNAFVKMKSTGIEPLNGPLQALIDTVSAFGGTSQQFDRAAIAIQQMSGKGVISMEELRQQLGEAVPRAVELMARSLGVSYGEFVQRVSTGTVEAKGALAAMFAEFDLTFGGRAQALMTTFNGLLSQIGTQWLLLQQQTGDAGFFEAAKDQLSDILSMMKTEDAKRFSRDLGEGLAEVIRLFREGIETIYAFRNEIVEAGKILATVFVIGRIGAFFGTLAAAARGTAAAFGALRTWVVSTHAAIVLAGTGATGTAAAMTTLRTGLLGVGTVIGGLTIAIRTLLGPIGLAALAIYELAQYFDVFGSKGTRALEDVKNGVAGLSMETLKLAEIENQRALQNVENTIKNGTAAMPTWSEAYKRALPELERQREELIATANANSQLIQQRIAELADDEASIASNRIIRGVQAQLARVTAAYDEGMVKVSDELQKGLIKREGPGGAVEQRKALLVKQVEDATAIIQQALDEQRAKVAEMTSKGETDTPAYKAAELSIQNLIGEMRKLAEERERYLALADQGFPTISSKESQKEIEALGQRYTTLRQQVAQVYAQMSDGGGPAEARLKAFLASTKELKDFGGDKSKLEAALKSLAVELDNAKEKYREYIAQVKAGDEALSQVADALFKVQTKGAELNESLGNPDVARMSQGYLNFVASIKKAINEIADPAKRALAEAFGTDAIEEYRRNEIKQGAISLRERTNQINLNLMRKREAIEEELRLDIERAQREIDLTKLTGQARIDAETNLNNYVAALRARAARELETPIQQMMRSWREGSERVQEWWADAMESATDKLVDFVANGKAAFGDFVVSILAELAKIKLQETLANSFSGVLENFGNSIAGFFGGGDQPVTIANTVFKAHTGGVVGKDSLAITRASAAVFAGAPRFHTGGFPGLRSDEVPIIAKKGEGVFTPEQMRALGGMGGTNVKINVVNQTGQPVEMTQGQPRFDGEQMVVDIVMKHLGRPGPLRDSLRGVG